jgi:hypothetical protein
MQACGAGYALTYLTTPLQKPTLASSSRRSNNWENGEQGNGPPKPRRETSCQGLHDMGWNVASVTGQHPATNKQTDKKLRQ